MASSTRENPHILRSLWIETRHIKIFLRSCIETSTKTWNHPPTHPHPKLNYFELQSAAGGALFSQGSKVNLSAFTRTETCQGLAVCHLKWRSRHLKFSNFEHCAHCAPFSDFEALLARREKVKKSSCQATFFVPFSIFVLSFCMRLKSLSCTQI